jgi:hypothetical protein
MEFGTPQAQVSTLMRCAPGVGIHRAFDRVSHNTRAGCGTDGKTGSLKQKGTTGAHDSNTGILTNPEQRRWIPHPTLYGIEDYFLEIHQQLRENGLMVWEIKLRKLRKLPMSLTGVFQVTHHFLLEIMYRLRENGLKGWQIKLKKLSTS